MAFFPSDAQQFALEPATSFDGPAIEEPARPDGTLFITDWLDLGDRSDDGWLVDTLAGELGMVGEAAVDADAGSLTVGASRSP